MDSRLQFMLLQLTRKLWFRSSLFSALAIGSALIAAPLSPYIPANLSIGLGAGSVYKILGVLASSMLAVTIFSLSTTVSAYIAASNSVTPRAFRLLISDGFTQNALATFIGAFLFSLVGLIALSTGIYGASGQLVMFVVTLGVIVFIVMTLLRWIDHVSRLGQVSETTDRIEEAATKAMRNRHKLPFMGGRPLLDRKDIPDDATPVHPRRIGYVQHIDMGALAELTEEHETGRIYVESLPGSFVDPAKPLAWVRGMPDEEAVRDTLRKAFTIHDLRSFDQDPRFGAIALSEIASRALSLGVNDPGTAIEVIGRAVRLLSIWANPEEGPDDPDSIDYPAIHVPGIDVADLFDDLFRPIARDGAGLIEVALRLQKGLHALARVGDERYLEPAQNHSRLALERALSTLQTENDRELVREAAAEVAAVQPSPTAWVLPPSKESSPA